MLHFWSTLHRAVVGSVVLLSLMTFAQQPDAHAQGVRSFTSLRPDEIIRVAPQQVRAGQANEVTVHLDFPPGYHLNPRAPLTYRVDVQGKGLMVRDKGRRFQEVAPALPLTIPFQAATVTHQAALDIDMTFSYCRQDNTGVCAIEWVRWQVPLHAVDDGTAVAPRVSYKVTAPVMQ